MTTTCDQPAQQASPRDHAGWLALARTTAAAPAVDDPDGRYAGRPQARGAEALRRAGLLALPIPAHHGGGGACWRTAYQVVREVAALYIGIAEGALNAARAHAVARSRPWPLGQARRNGGDAYLSGAYGGLLAQVRAARALADQAVEELSPALHGADAAEPSGRACGAPGVLVATAKIAAVQASLAVASRVFELAGPGSARSSPGLARFWHYARALHDPVAYRQTEVGREFLTGEFPPERNTPP
ncbi:acyl-CoA dehydrogenase family protein [Actinomadura napierensis]|uniref:Acyl-CoA dehydrogenase C-terminal domain-containing protein n=1 Tax=Actinomadura napierensis TaxID=267854 RepID=A0ABN2Y027_9ACTN